jgi:hypothetical protein
MRLDYIEMIIHLVSWISCGQKTFSVALDTTKLVFYKKMSNSPYKFEDKRIPTASAIINVVLESFGNKNIFLDLDEAKLVFSK